VLGVRGPGPGDKGRSGRYLRPERHAAARRAAEMPGEVPELHGPYWYSTALQAGHGIRASTWVRGCPTGWQRSLCPGKMREGRG